MAFFLCTITVFNVLPCVSHVLCSHWVVVDSRNNHPSLSLFEGEQLHFSQIVQVPLYIMFLRSLIILMALPLLDFVQYDYVCLILWSPGQIVSHKCWREGKNHFLWPFFLCLSSFKCCLTKKYNQTKKTNCMLMWLFLSKILQKFYF